MKLLDDELNPIIATVAAEVGNGEDNEKSDALQAFTYLSDKTAQFLKKLEPTWRDTSDYATKLLTDLVPSSDGSYSDFVDITPTLSFLQQTARCSLPIILANLMKTDLISNIFTAVQPHTLSISGNEEMSIHLI
ncbi:hypothetical protein BLNAU_4980 [Blattamonas nauphoetae]|uniref:Uncharacterized protein n=1 Tax=Blattamonas nauphoetae TaxID=2049346 RepID=A0ABQ9Y8N6_9EUKA|nr:hypothetical protein BLNAU_4980 [Blattamonas nauphoetae]